MQTELAHGNRLATMGQLTASIAHEIRQPIAATITNAQAALRWLARDPLDREEVRQALARIIRDGSRAGDVISRIRGLIKKAPQQQDLLEINGAVREVIELTHAEAVKNNVSVRTDLADSLPLLHGDRVQLQQVLVNLVINAVEAVGTVAEGAREVLITTGKDEPNGVLVAIKDSGAACPQQLASTSSSRSTRPSPAGWGWGCRSAGRSSRLTGDDCGRRRTNRGVPCFSSRCQPTRAAHCDWDAGTVSCRQVPVWACKRARATRRGPIRVSWRGECPLPAHGRGSGISQGQALRPSQTLGSCENCL